MTRNIVLNLTVEELNMILLCSSREKDKIIQELQSYLDVAKPDMAEIIQKSIKKLDDMTEEDLKEVLDYPPEY